MCETFSEMFCIDGIAFSEDFLVVLNREEISIRFFQVLSIVLAIISSSFLYDHISSYVLALLKFILRYI